MPARRGTVLVSGDPDMDRAIPLFLNERAGRAGEIADALIADKGFDVRRLAPEAIDDEIAREIEDGAGRVAVAGGDGTIAAAASLVAGTPVELAIIPGGTLNHFAQHLGIPADLAEAGALASAGDATALVDVGRVNDRLMLNTSAVGIYAAFVRERDRIEHRYGYAIASLLAALRLLSHLRTVRVELEVEGQTRTYRTPLLFVGVGEREVRVPMLGARVEGGARQLHVIVLRGRSAWGLVAAAVLAAVRGVHEVSRTSHLDSFLVDRCVVRTHRRTVVAVDGELVTLESPLEYRIDRDALRVVVPTVEE